MFFFFYFFRSKINDEQATVYPRVEKINENNDEYRALTVAQQEPARKFLQAWVPPTQDHPKDMGQSAEFIRQNPELPKSRSLLMK